jgi:colanic acid/amylovoran biosynthesis glycosyltransferase
VRVAFLTDALPAPSQTFVLDQARGLMRYGVDLEVLADVCGPDAQTDDVPVVRLSVPAALVARVLGALARVLRLAAFRGLSPWRAGGLPRPRAAYVLHALAARRPFDVIHCHFGVNGRVGAAVRPHLPAGPRLVVTFYGHDASAYVRRHGAGCYARLFAEADLVLTVSDAMRERLVALGCPRARVRVHPLAVDVAFFAPGNAAATPGPPRVVTVARLVPKKGIEDALDAVALLARAGIRLSYVIAGDGPLRDFLAQRSVQLGVADRVEFRGWQSRSVVRDLLRGAAVLLLPCRTGPDGDEEGTPVAILEALACGLPVVSTRHAGIPEVVHDGTDGLLVDEGDVPGLAASVGDLLANPARREKMGLRGREWVVEHRSQDVVSRALLDLYSGLGAVA